MEMGIETTMKSNTINNTPNTEKNNIENNNENTEKNNIREDTKTYNRNIKMTVSYDGAKYNGWQKQGNTHNTLQEKFEELLSRILEEDIEVNASGRTDAGVNAFGQVINFHTHNSIEVNICQRI